MTTGRWGRGRLALARADRRAWPDPPSIRVPCGAPSCHSPLEGESKKRPRRLRRARFFRWGEFLRRRLLALDNDGPSEGRHPAFPSARQRADLLATRRSAPNDFFAEALYPGTSCTERTVPRIVSHPTIGRDRPGMAISRDTSISSYTPRTHSAHRRPRRPEDAIASPSRRGCRSIT